MKLYCLATYAVALVLTTVYVDEVEARIGMLRDDLRDFDWKLSREEDLKHYAHLLAGKRPVRPQSHDVNSIINEPVQKKTFSDKEWYELYHQNVYRDLKERAESPASLPDEGSGDVPDTSLDQITDFLLALANKEIVARGKDQVPIPNMSEEFEKRIAFINVHGKFDAQNGWFRNLSTIQRTGDVVATIRGSDTLVVSCELGLATMLFGFDSYQANLAGLSVRGHMTGSVASNSVSLQVAASYVDGKCNVTLERLAVDRFDGLDVELTGLGDMSWLLDSIAGWATKHFKDDIVSTIDENINKIVADVLSKLQCSELMQHLPAQETTVLMV